MTSLPAVSGCLCARPVVAGATVEYVPAVSPHACVFPLEVACIVAALPPNSFSDIEAHHSECPAVLSATTYLITMLLSHFLIFHCQISSLKRGLR